LLLYLHIPFCHRVCPYCSFYKHTPGATPISAFIDALTAEADHRLPQLSEKPRTLYLGGGTPSMLSPTHLEKLFNALHKHLDFSQLDDVTFEANPATFDLTKATLFRDLGVKRVSLGIQSFTPHVLKTLGREHDPEQATEAVQLLKQAGLPAINIDLMFSIPGQTRHDWSSTLDHAISLQPDHISAYNLTYEEDTAFFESLKRGELDQSEDRDASFFELAKQQLTTAGFQSYETSNYAQPGHRSSHNHGYWSGEDYLGLGPSAVSTLDRSRSRNVPDTARYVEMIRSLGHAITESEPLDDEAWRLERIALGLRTLDGIALSLLDAEGQTRAGWLIEQGLAERDHDRLRLIGHGCALVDPIAAELV
jgi:oxygen-independent coproporphyrinogen III oxidase